MSDSSNRTFEVLEFLAGMYDMPDPGVIRFRLCIAKGNSQLDTAGMTFRARKGEETREIFPKGLHVAREHVVMRVAPDVLPKGWIGRCSISLVCRKPFVCYPVMLAEDLDAGTLVRPELKSERPQPQEAASP